jgi:hypothetical protein
LIPAGTGMRKFHNKIVASKEEYDTLVSAREESRSKEFSTN